MKKLITAALTLVSLNAFASDYEVLKTDKCKYRAEVVAMEKALKQNQDPYMQVGVMAREKSVIKDDTIFHFIDVQSAANNNRSHMVTVALDIKTCKIKSIN